MLLRFDPFRELDRLSQQLWDEGRTPARAVPMDAVRRGEHLVVFFDLPGGDASTIDLTVERNQLTLTAERSATPGEGEELLVAERPRGTFTRRLFLGDNLDTERIQADYHDGVLEVTIPVAEQAKARKVSIGGTNGQSQPIEATSASAN